MNKRANGLGRACLALTAALVLAALAATLYLAAPARWPAALRAVLALLAVAALLRAAAWAWTRIDLVRLRPPAWWARYGTLAVFAVALGARLAMLLVVPTSPVSDFALYLERARMLASGAGEPWDAYVVVIAPNAWAFIQVLAGWLRLLGSSVASAQALVALCFAGMAALFHEVARRVAPRPAAAAAALWVAVSPETLSYTLHIGNEPLAMLLLMAGILCLTELLQGKARGAKCGAAWSAKCGAVVGLPEGMAHSAMARVTPCVVPPKTAHDVADPLCGGSSRSIPTRAVTHMRPISRIARPAVLALSAGLTLAACQAVRPIAALALVPAVAYALLSPRDGGRARRLAWLILALAAFLAFDALLCALRERSFGCAAASGLGWPLYEGLDLSSGGKWTAQKSAVLQALLDTLPAGEVQPALTRLAMERVSAYTPRDWSALLASKLAALWGDCGYLTAGLDGRLPAAALATACLWAQLLLVCAQAPRASGGVAALCAAPALLLTLYGLAGTSIGRYHFVALPFVALCLATMGAERRARYEAYTIIGNNEKNPCRARRFRV